MSNNLPKIKGYSVYIIYVNILGFERNVKKRVLYNCCSERR